MKDNKENNALEVVKQMIKDGQISQDVAEKYFPELKEHKDIKQELLDFLETLFALGKNMNFDKWDKFDCARWINWIRNQFEHQKFRDSIQIGDKVTRNEDGELVNLSQLERVAKKGDNKFSKQSQRMISASAKEALYNKPIWSEEDEAIKDDAIYFIEQFRKNQAKNENDFQNAVTCENWLKNIKNRIQSKEDNWKPTKEQVEILDMILTDEAMDSNVSKILKELKEQLEKFL